MIDPVTGMIIGGLAGGSSKLLGYPAAKRAYEDDARNITTQNAWAWATGSPIQTRLQMKRPGLLPMVGEGIIKGGMTGLGASADLARAYKPEGAQSITNITSAGGGGNPWMAMPSTGNQGAMNEIQQNIDAGMAGGAGRAPASVGFARPMSANMYPGGLRPVHWSMYGGTGGR
jgi:hypothetical protein